MEQRDGNGSSEHLSLEFDVTRSSRMTIDEDPVDHDEMLGRASSSSFSSSSSISTSFELEVDYGENDMIYTEFEGYGSSSPSSNPESPSTTRKSTTESYDVNTLNLSPKQSPPIQVMRQPSGYDPNRIPSSIFDQKDTNDSEWSFASNESLFSIQMGNNSFSLDNGFFISKSGKLNWVDDGVDYSCFTPDANKSSDFTSMPPGLPAMVEKAADDEWKSASLNGESEDKKELIETHDQLSSDSEREEEESSPSWKGLQLANPTEESLDSDETAKRNSSFTFPVLAGGSPSKVDAEGSPPPSSTSKGAAEAETAPEAPSTTPKAENSMVQPSLYSNKQQQHLMRRVEICPPFLSSQCPNCIKINKIPCCNEKLSLSSDGNKTRRDLTTGIQESNSHSDPLQGKRIRFVSI